MTKIVDTSNLAPILEARADQEGLGDTGMISLHPLSGDSGRAEYVFSESTEVKTKKVKKKASIALMHLETMKPESAKKK